MFSVRYWFPDSSSVWAGSGWRTGYTCKLRWWMTQLKTPKTGHLLQLWQKNWSRKRNEYVEVGMWEIEQRMQWEQLENRGRASAHDALQHHQVLHKELWEVRGEADWLLISAADNCDLRLIKNTSSLGGARSLWATVKQANNHSSCILLITCDSGTLRGWEEIRRSCSLYLSRKRRQYMFTFSVLPRSQT